MLSLRSAAQPVPDPAVGQHDLEAEHQLAGHAVAQHRGAAGVGREVAADRAAALGAQRHREEPVDLLGRGLHVGQHDAGVDGDRCRRPGRPRAPGASGRGTAPPGCPTRRAPRRRPARCCRPAARPPRPLAAQAATTAATSSVEPGRTTARARPAWVPVQSTTYAATSASSVRTWSAPMLVRSWSSRSSMVLLWSGVRVSPAARRRAAPRAARRGWSPGWSPARHPRRRGSGWRAGRCSARSAGRR